MKRENEITRKQFLQGLCIFTGGYLLRQIPDGKLKEAELNEHTLSYITQETKNQCGYAVMAMTIADKKNDDVKEVYENIVHYYKDIDRFDISLSAEALEDYLNRKAKLSAEKSYNPEWNANEVKEQINLYGSTIFCVTSNYGEAVPFENGANHWIIVDGFLIQNNRDFALVRDPLHSAKEFNPLDGLKPFMIPNPDGSVNIPTDILIPALGNNYFYIRNKGNQKVLEKYKNN